VPSAVAVISIVLAALSFVGGCSKAPRTNPPNVLLITIDTLRADHLGSYGYDFDTSPNLDRLARNSVRFADAVSASSWTLPGHASILTGLFPSQHGVERDINALPASADTLAERLKRAGYETFAATSHVYLTGRWGFHQGFDEYDQRAAVGSPQKPVATKIVNSALQWLEQRGFIDGEPAKPFFAWLHIFDPHWDYAAPPPFSTQFDPDYTGTMRGDYASLRPFIKAVVGYDQPPPMPERDLRHVNALYDGEIAYVDDELGRLFDALRRHDLFEDTLIVVTSDHGEEMMEHGSLEGHQWTLYEEVIRVPLIMHPPASGCMHGVSFGSARVIERSVSNVGVAATILDCTGEDSTGLPSLTALLRGDADGSSPVVDELLLDLTVRHRTRSAALRTPEHKLIHTFGGATQLYGKPAVGAEVDDLSAQDPGKTARLKARLDARLGTLERLEDAGAIRAALDPATADRLRATGYLD
jgi:arylsulfatase A-like enzyme